MVFRYLGVVLIVVVREGPLWNLLFCVFCLIAGTAIMALLGKWA